MFSKLTSPSTKRAVRTAIDGALGVLAVLAVIVPVLHQFGVSMDNEVAIGGLILATTTAISKVKNKLEELGYLPAFLKDSDS